MTTKDRLASLIAQSRRATRPASDVLATAAIAIERRKQAWTTQGRDGLSQSGEWLDRTGGTLAKRARSLRIDGEVAARYGDGMAHKALGGLKLGLGAIGEWLGNGSRMTGKGIQRAADPVARGVTHALAGGVSLVSEAVDAVSISGDDLALYRGMLEGQAAAQRARFDGLTQDLEAAAHTRRRDDLLDQLVVGGVVLSTVIRNGAAIPPDVEAAYLAAYPSLAQVPLAETIDRLPTESLPGLAAAIKGKLFELRFVEHLNDGQLPDGHRAELALSATQPGWDLRILDPSGNVSEVLSAKATESAGYVADALTRYPGIDVVTTSEVYAQLVAQGFADQVRDAGISNAALEATVDQAIAGTADGFGWTDLLPSTLGMAVIGLSVFMDRSLTHERAIEVFGDRTGRAGVSATAGKALLAVSQLWWLALIGGVGVHWLSVRGRGRRQQYEALREVVVQLYMLDQRHGRDPWAAFLLK